MSLRSLGGPAQMQSRDNQTSHNVTWRSTSSPVADGPARRPCRALCARSFSAVRRVRWPRIGEASPAATSAISAIVPSTTFSLLCLHHLPAFSRTRCRRLPQCSPPTTMRRRLPGGAVGLLDEHGPALVLPSYSGDCLAPWVSAERETLADAVELAQDPLAALHGWHGRLHGSYFLPIGHGGHNFSVGFNFLLPPPYRVVMLIAASLLLFAMILALLDRLGLDVSRLPVFGASAFASTHASRTARQASSTTPGHSALAHRSHHSSVDLALQHFSRESRDGGERETPGSPRSRTSSADRAYTALTVGTLYLVVATIAWLLFRYWVDGPPHGDPIGNHAQLYQAAVPLFALFVLFWPGNQLGRAVRYAYLRASWRIVIPSLRQRISFDDLLLADTLTSVGKVFGDVWLALCFLLPRNEHHTWYTGHGSWAIPWVHSIPYLIRLRQCLSEYFTSGPSVPYQDAKGGWHQRRSRKPLANALKYASSLPVIWLSTLHEHANDWKALEIDTRVLPPDYYLKGVRGYAQSIHRLWYVVSFFCLCISEFPLAYRPREKHTVLTIPGWNRKAFGCRCQLSLLILVGCDERLGSQYLAPTCLDRNPGLFRSVHMDLGRACTNKRTLHHFGTWSTHAHGLRALVTRGPAES